MYVFLFYGIPLGEITPLNISFLASWSHRSWKLLKKTWNNTNGAILTCFPHLIILCQFRKHPHYISLPLQSLYDEDDDAHFLTPPQPSVYHTPPVLTNLAWSCTNSQRVKCFTPSFNSNIIMRFETAVLS